MSVGKKNLYLCQKCGWAFVSHDLDEGTTPFLMGCQRDECSGMAQSFMYRAPQELLAPVPAVIEWFKPDDGEFAELSEPMRQHVAKGGLTWRKVDEGPD